jgi:integrase/recombinase XerC
MQGSFGCRVELGEVVMSKSDAAGAAKLVVVPGVPLLRPEAQVFEAMLDGWRQQ